MTSAERPTQEVAPRTDDEPTYRWVPLDNDCKRHFGPHEGFRCNGAYGRLIEVWAEASRSAPPAAVTAEQLAEALRLDVGGTSDGNPYAPGAPPWADYKAAAILSKITPAQPSASSEGDEEHCIETVWDGPYRMVCGRTIVKGACGLHGKNAKRAVTRPAAKPTGSADEPLLRAALPLIERFVAEKPDCGHAVLLEVIRQKLRAALASAEPAEPQP